MARIWQEGFEDGLPSFDYLEGTPDSQFIYGLSLYKIPTYNRLSSGRNAYSKNSLYLYSSVANIGEHITKIFNGKSELYTRAYIALSATTSNSINKELIWLTDGSNALLSVYHITALDATAFAIYARVNGTYSQVATLTLGMDTWYKIELYYKVSATSGAYEVRVNDSIIVSASSQNTGTANVTVIKIGFNYGAGSNARYRIKIDDLAINDTSGTVNNSWCGNGTIVSLKPKGSGNSSQFDTSQGWVKAESGTGTTTLKITNHGLSTGDVIYNETRAVYSTVTVVDANTLTTSSISSQAQYDVIQAFAYSATIAATIGTSTAQVVLNGHNLISGDVFVNTTRSNAIRKVIYVNSTTVVNSYTVYYDGTSGALGSSVTSQASGDSIKTFKVKQYPIANHYEAVNNSVPNPQYSNIQSTTVGDIDLFDMQELVADKGFPAGSTIVTVACNIYAKENGAGSQIKPVLRSGSTNNEGSTIGLSGGTLQYQTIYNTSPFTSSAWTRSEVDGLEAGVKLV